MALLQYRSFALKTRLPALGISRSLRSKAQGGAKYAEEDDYFSNLLSDSLHINHLGREYGLVQFWDRSFKKYNDNFKAISIEGSVGVGKGLLAQRLSEALEMNYIKDVTEDDIFKTDDYGFEFDFRSLNMVLPDNIQLSDLKNLWNDEDPIRKGRPLALQRSFYTNRYFNYAKAMSLLFNTGTGFIINRAPHGDWTIARAMRDCGLMSHKAYDWYELNFVNTICEMFRPHLFIHLKAPVSYVRQQINEKKILGKDTKNLTDKFLEILDENIHEYLQSMKKHSEIFEIDVHNLDWNDPLEVDHIVTELCNIDLEGHEYNDLQPKFLHWRKAIKTRDSFDNNRKTFSSAQAKFTNVFHLVQMPDTLREGRFDRYEQLVIKDVLARHPVLAYRPQFHPSHFSFPKSLFVNPKVPRNYDADLPKLFLGF